MHKLFSVSGHDVKALDIHVKGKRHLLGCPPSNQQKSKISGGGNEKDDATDRSKIKVP